MANITSAQSGDANDPATWVGGVVPVAPNCAIIANGHTVTNPVGYTWVLGDASAPTVPALRSTGTGGTGIFVNRGTLQVYADIQQCDSNWTLHAGSRIQYMNTSTLLQHFIGNDHSQSNSKLTLAGTGTGSGRVTFEPGPGSAGYRVRGANVGGPSTQVVGSWAIFKNSGSSTVPALSVGCNTSAGQLDIEQVIFDGGGRLDGPLTIQNNNLWRLRNCTFKNTQGTNSVTTLTAAGTRTQDVLYENCVFDKLPKNTGPNVKFRKCVIPRIDINATQSEMSDVILHDTLGAGNVIATHATPVVRGFRVRVNGGAGNFHGLVVKDGGSVDGMVFDGVSSDAAGDMIQTDASTNVAYIRNVLTTRSAHVTGSFGKLFGIASVTSTCASVTHCTQSCYAGIEGALVNVGETNAGTTGMIGELRHNISRGLSAGSGLLIARLSAGAVGNIKDAVTPANITDNVVPSPYAGGAGVGPAALTAAGGDGIMFTALPTAPLDLDPMFVDDTRNLATWYRSLVGGTPDTRSNDTLAAIAAISTMNDDSPISGATIEAAYAWVRAGYAPRNPRCRTGVSTANGGWVGAVPGNNNARLLAHGMI